MRLAILASGTGSNFDAIADYFKRRGASSVVEVVAVISNRADAAVLEKARLRGIAALLLSNAADAQEMLRVLRGVGPNMLALAGYLKLVPNEVVNEFRDRILNVHPSLLPAFGGAGMYGDRVHEAVLESGAALSGATVHFVSAEYDRGAILAQWRVPVAPGDSASQLARRVLTVEHLMYARVIEAVALGAISASNPVTIAQGEDGVAILDKLLRA